MLSNYYPKRIYLVAIAVFGVAGVVMPFSSLWLQANGIDTIRIAQIISLGYLFRSVFTLAIVFFFKHLSPTVSISWISCFLLLSTSFMFDSNNYTAISTLTIMVIGMTFALQPISEAYLVNRVNEQKANYGLSKLIGSLTFVLSGVTIPFFYEFMPIDQLYPLSIGFFSIALFIASLSSTGPMLIRESGNWKDLVALSSGTLPVLIAATLIQGSNAYYYSMAFVVWDESGIEAGTMSWLWALAIFSEVVAFRICVSTFARWDISRIIALCSIITTVRWATFSVTIWEPALLFAQIGHAFSFAICHFAVTREIAIRFPQEHQVAAHGVSAFSISFFGLFLGMALVIPTSFSIGVNPYIAMAALSASAFFILKT